MHSPKSRGPSPKPAQTARMPRATSPLQRAADHSTPVRQLARLQGAADRAPLQLRGREFVGDPAVWHCHLVGQRGQEHVKMGNNQGTRKDYYPDRRNSVQTAIDHLEELGNNGQSGYTECHAYLTGLL